MQNRATGKIRLFMLTEACAFSLAAAIHFAVLVQGYQHHAAGTAESVIAAVLWIGLVLSGLLAGWTRAAGLVTQGFAAFGTLVGITTIIVGIGPQTLPDIAYHVVILIVLIFGLVVTARARQNGLAKQAHTETS